MVKTLSDFIPLPEYPKSTSDLEDFMEAFESWNVWYNHHYTAILSILRENYDIDNDHFLVNKHYPTIFICEHFFLGEKVAQASAALKREAGYSNQKVAKELEKDRLTIFVNSAKIYS